MIAGAAQGIALGGNQAYLFNAFLRINVNHVVGSCGRAGSVAGEN
jgi:hypothetical protein